MQRWHVDGTGCSKAFKWLANYPHLRIQWKDAPLLHGLPPIPASPSPSSPTRCSLLGWFKLLFMRDLHLDVVADETYIRNL
jgi:hypothetical protein